jgi:hypothetical protein
LPLSLASEPEGLPGPIHDRLQTLAESFALIAAPWTGERIELEIRFAEPVPIQNPEAPPKIRVNALPVWNSVACRYPEPWQVAQQVADPERRTIHPLEPRGPGDRWRPWRVERVGTAGNDPSLRGRVEDGGATYDYLLAHLPADPPAGPFASGDGDPRGPLCILLTEEARRTLSERRQRLTVRYLATQGSLANGVPAGSEFQLVDPSGPMHARTTARLVTRTWGGIDGVPVDVFDELGRERLRALRRTTGPRTVREAKTVIANFSAGDIEIVDERDFLRVAGGVMEEELPIRVRVRPLPAGEARALVGSCERFVNRYLAPSGPVRLVPELHRSERMP